MTSDLLTWLTAAAVAVFYVVMWFLVGRDPKRGTIVVQYEPPGALSPAMLRYLWKEKFDDRIFWAGLLSLVAKGVATLEAHENDTRVRIVSHLRHKPALPQEERFLLEKALRPCGSEGLSTNLLDENTTSWIWGMAVVLRQAAVGRFFLDNRECVIAGAVLSLAPIYISAQVHSPEQLIVLAWALIVMAPGGFYATILVPHAVELIASSHGFRFAAIARHAVRLLVGLLASFAGLLAGAWILGVDFGIRMLFVTSLMVAFALAFLHLMKAPTAEGRKLMDGIEGFRQFLSSVEKLPMDRLEAPAESPGLYEKYLPYAIALEVEQAWSEQFLAAAESAPEWEFWSGSYPLGIWNNEPLTVRLPRKARRTHR